LRGLSRLADYGMHVYYNVPQLVEHVPLSRAGNPWRLPQNKRWVRDYGRGACPKSDALFERSVLVAVPSRLTRAQERRMAGIIRKAVERARGGAAA
jgi:8-amino-3,8-dideoxy-alpha-D-manno-octulosonate transaminase